MMFPQLTKDDIEVRVGTIARSGNSLTLLLYKDARVDMRLLDETVGVENWQARYYRCNDSLFCSVGIRSDGDWVWKDDCGTESNMESKKGEASDAFKRACFRWGIGRELYTAPEIRVPNGLAQIKEGKCWDRFRVGEIAYKDGRIQDLTIINDSTGRICYSTRKKGAEDAVKDSLYPQVVERMTEVASERGISLAQLTDELRERLGSDIDGTNHACMLWVLKQLGDRDELGTGD